MTGGLAFRIRGIPVRIDLSFLLIVVLLGLGARSGMLLVSWVAIVTASVLLHEMGHAVAFRMYGQRAEIFLQGMGGLTTGSGEALTPRRDLVVSLAGPLTGLVLLGLPALWLARSDTELSSTWEAVVADVVFVNLAWSVLNLLPVLPLDGGRVSAALWSLGTGGEGIRQAHLLSVVVAGAAAVYSFSRGYLFGALFAGFFCAYNVSRLSAGRNASLSERLVEGWQALARDDPPGAAAVAEAVLSDRPSAPVMGAAMELLAWSRLAEGDADRARDALRRYPHGRAPDPFLSAALELDAGRRDEALDFLVAGYGREVFGPAAPVVADAAVRAGLVQPLLNRLLAVDGPGPSAVAHVAVHLHTARHFEHAAAAGQQAFDAGDSQTRGRVAYNLACTHALAGHHDVALDWLERAADGGFAEVSLLDTDPDLESLRGTARFRALRARLAEGS